MPSRKVVWLRAEANTGSSAPGPSILTLTAVIITGVPGSMSIFTFHSRASPEKSDFTTGS